MKANNTNQWESFTVVNKFKQGYVPENILCNPYISLGAKGLLCYLTVKDDDTWDMAQMYLGKETLEGEEDIRHYMNELISGGIISVEEVINEDGTSDTIYKI